MDALRGAVTGPLARGGLRRYQTRPKYLAAAPQTIYEEFDTVGDWAAGGGATLAADTTHVASGTAALKITTASGVTGTATKSSLAWDLSAAQSFRIHVWLDATTPLGGFTLILGNDAASWTNYVQAAITPGNFMIGWNALEIARASFTATGSGSLNSTVRRLRISVSTQASSVTVLTVDRFAAGALAGPAVMFTFDDGHVSVINSAYPALASHGMRATAYIPADYIGTTNYMTAAQLQTLDAAGWSIGNHSKTHTDLSTLSEADQETELSACRTTLESLGLTRASRHVAYPVGGYNLDTLTAMTNTGMLTGRNTKTAYYEVLPDGLYNIRCKGYVYNTTTLAVAKGYADAALAAGQVCVYLFHRLLASPSQANEWAIADFQALVEYVAGLGAPVLTIGDFYALNSGPVSVPLIH